nr:immunoglobulin light chain junction region [Macaca mulatta]
RQQGYSYPYSF